MNLTVTKPLIQRNSRADQLQFLRFLAFFCVFIEHAEIWLFFPFPSGNCSDTAVAFFFMLSGFVIGYSSYGKEIRFSLKQYGNSIWKKICRIYPLYFFTTIVFVFGSQVPLHLAAGPINNNTLPLFKNLLMIQAWFPKDPLVFNGLGWYVSVLMFLNLFSLPAVILFHKLAKHPKRFYIFTALICSFVFGITVFCYATKHLDTGYWHYIFPPARLGEFLGGIVLGYWVSIIQPWIKLGKLEKWLFTILEAGALILWFCAMNVFGSPWRVYIVNWLIPNTVLLTVFTLGRGWISRIFCWRPLVRLGDISFECYLIHNIFVKNLTWNCPQFAETQQGKAFAFLFCFCMSILTSLYINKASAKK